MTTTISGSTGVSQVQDGIVTPAKLTQPFTVDTVKNASGTFVDFTGIPSWVKRISLMTSDLSSNGTSNFLVQIGTGGVPTSSGYLGASSGMGGAVGSTSFTTGCGIVAGAASVVLRGTIVIENLTDDKWVFTGILARSDTAATVLSASAVTLGGVLDMVRLTTVNGTDTFDSGTVNIMYEG